ncbi:MAG: hypothetical protein AAF694_01005 [Bacteroidota bacterium]
MRKLFPLCLAFFLTTSAFADSGTATQNSAPLEEIVIVSHVDFTKTLSMVILDVEMKEFTLKLEDPNGNEIFRTQVRTGESEVMEIDLSDVDGGNYQLKISADSHVQTESVIVPVG